MRGEEHRRSAGPLERERDAAVPLRALRGRLFRDQGVAEELVGEPVRAQGAGLEHLRRNRPVDERPHGLHAGAGRVGQHVDREVAGEQRREREELRGRAAQLCDPLPHDVAHLGRARPLDDDALGRSHAQRLGEQEGVAAGQVVQRLHQLLDLFDVHPFEELADLTGLERPELDALQQVPAAERSDRPGQAGRRRPIRTHTRDDEHASRDAHRAQLPDHVQERVAGILDVVDDHDDRQLRRQRRRPSGDALEQQVLGHDLCNRQPLRERTRDLAYPRNFAHLWVGNVLDDHRKLSVRQAECGLGQRTRKRVDRRAVDVVRVYGDHNRVACDAPRDLQQESGLADAGPAFDEHDPHSLLDCLREAGQDCSILGAAADERQRLDRPCGQRSHGSALCR